MTDKDDLRRCIGDCFYWWDIIIAKRIGRCLYASVCRDVRFNNKYLAVTWRLHPDWPHRYLTHESSDMLSVEEAMADYMRRLA